MTKSSSISGSRFGSAFVVVGTTGVSASNDLLTSVQVIVGGGLDDTEVEGEGLRLCPDILRRGRLGVQSTEEPRNELTLLLHVHCHPSGDGDDHSLLGFFDKENLCANDVHPSGACHGRDPVHDVYPVL